LVPAIREITETVTPRGTQAANPSAATGTPVPADREDRRGCWRLV